MKRSVVISMFVLCACLAAAQDVTKIGSVAVDVPVEKPVTKKAPIKTAPIDEVTVAEVAKATRKVAKGEFVTANQVQAKIARALARTSKASPNYKWLSQLKRELKDAINNYNAEKLANKTSRELVTKHEWRLDQHGKYIHNLEAADRTINGRLDSFETRLKDVEDRPTETEKVIEKTTQSQWPLWLSIAALVVALATAVGVFAGKIKLPEALKRAPKPAPAKAPIDNRKTWEKTSLAEAWQTFKTSQQLEAVAVSKGENPGIKAFSDFLNRVYKDVPENVFGKPLQDVIAANPPT